MAGGAGSNAMDTIIYNIFQLLNKILPLALRAVLILKTAFHRKCHKVAGGKSGRWKIWVEVVGHYANGTT